MGFNSAFKGLKNIEKYTVYMAVILVMCLKMASSLPATYSLNILHVYCKMKLCLTESSFWYCKYIC